MTRFSVRSLLGAMACALVMSLALGIGDTQAQQGELAKIKAAGVIRVGIAADPPYTFQDPNGDWKSFIPELVRKLGPYLGVKIEFVGTTWTTIVAGLQADKYDIIGASINATPERAKAIDFTIPYNYAGSYYYIRKDNPKNFKTLDDLNKPEVTIAFVTGASDDETTRRYLPKATYRAIPNASTADLLSELESKRSDAVCTGSFLAQAITSKYPYYFLPTAADKPNGLDAVGVSWGVPKGNPDLMDALNKFIDQETKNGDIAKLKAEWFTEENAMK
jgi:polar amino acid transport system substrate-binding protein